MIRAMRLVLLLACVLALTACDDDVHPDIGPEEGSALVQVSAGDLPVAEDVPVPDEVVLSLEGPMLAVTNDGARLALDLATLERLPQVRTTVYEPFVEREVTFTGVPMSDLVGWAADGADVAAVVALGLDDYHITFTPQQLDHAVLALREDGAPIGLDNAGPTRIVFAPDSDIGDNPDLWIWSLESLSLQ